MNTTITPGWRGNGVIQHYYGADRWTLCRNRFMHEDQPPQPAGERQYQCPQCRAILAAGPAVDVALDVTSDEMEAI